MSIAAVDTRVLRSPRDVIPRLHTRLGVALGDQGAGAGSAGPRVIPARVSVVSIRAELTVRATRAVLAGLKAKQIYDKFSKYS